MEHGALAQRTIGLTVLELLTAVAVTALLATAGVPALRAFVLDAQRRNAVSGLVSVIQFARSAALTRNTTIRLCRAGREDGCASEQMTGHAAGQRWIVTTAHPQRPDEATAARPLRVLELSYSAKVRSNRATFEFRPFPLRSTNGTITLCDSRGGVSQRAVVISTSGRPRVAQPSSQAGFSACSGG